MSQHSIRIATAQSAISADPQVNGAHIRRLMGRAARDGARLIHFPEGALSGYVKSQIRSWDEVDWRALQMELAAVAACAAEFGLWVVLGSNHLGDRRSRPYNSLQVISDTGAIHARYDKRYCSQTEIADWYLPGTAPMVFAVDGWRFGCALCIEIHFPELFAEYERLDVDYLLFSSYSKDPIFGIEAQAHAAINGYWLSAAIPAQCSQALSSHLIGPDGQVLTRCRPGRSTMIVTELDRQAAAFDIALTKARPWRRAARQGDVYTDALRVKD
jgi:predicted amidohydrolase